MTAVDGAVRSDARDGAGDACGAAHAEGDCTTLEGDLARQARSLAGEGLRAARDGMLHRGRALLEQAALLGALQPAEWSALGLCALATGDVRTALGAWRQAAADDPDGDAARWMASAEHGPVRRALEAYDAAAQAVRDARLEEARRMLESARAALPEFVPAARLAGLVQAAQGDMVGARESWRAAARVCRDDADLLGLLAGSADREAAPRPVGEHAPTSERGRRADPTDLALDEHELARVMGAADELDPAALSELATVEARVRAGWRRVRSTAAHYAVQPPGTWGHRLSSPRVRIAAGIGAALVAGLLIYSRTGHRTASTASGRLDRDTGVAAAADSSGGRGRAAPPAPEALAARVLGAALGGNRDSIASAIALVGDARRGWPLTLQQRAEQIQSAVGRERYRAGRAAMAARKWDAAAAELRLAAAYGAFTPWHDSAFYYLAQSQSRLGDAAAAGRTARDLVARYPSSELSRDTMVLRLTSGRASPPAGGESP